MTSFGCKQFALLLGAIVVHMSPCLLAQRSSYGKMPSKQVSEKGDKEKYDKSAKWTGDKSGWTESKPQNGKTTSDGQGSIQSKPQMSSGARGDWNEKSKGEKQERAGSGARQGDSGRQVPSNLGGDSGKMSSAREGHSSVQQNGRQDDSGKMPNKAGDSSRMPPGGHGDSDSLSGQQKGREGDLGKMPPNQVGDSGGKSSGKPPSDGQFGQQSGGQGQKGREGDFGKTPSGQAGDPFRMPDNSGRQGGTQNARQGDSARTPPDQAGNTGRIRTGSGQQGDSGRMPSNQGSDSSRMPPSRNGDSDRPSGQQKGGEGDREHQMASDRKCGPSSPCTLQRSSSGSPSPKQNRKVEQVRGELSVSVADPSKAISDTTLHDVFAGAIANVAGAKKEDVRIISLSPVRRLDPLRVVSGNLRRLGGLVRVDFTVDATSLDRADIMASSLAGVSSTAMKAEIDIEMSRAGKSYSVQVTSITASPPSSLAGSHGPVATKASDENGASIVALAVATIGGLFLCFCCIAVACLWTSRRSTKAVATVSPDCVVVKDDALNAKPGVRAHVTAIPQQIQPVFHEVRSKAVVKGNGLSAKPGTQTHSTAPHKIRPVLDDAWSEASTEVGSNASVSRPSSSASGQCAWSPPASRTAFSSHNAVNSRKGGKSPQYMAPPTPAVATHQPIATHIRSSSTPPAQFYTSSQRVPDAMRCSDHSGTTNSQGSETSRTYSRTPGISTPTHGKQQHELDKRRSSETVSESAPRSSSVRANCYGQPMVSESPVFRSGSTEVGRSSSSTGMLQHGQRARPEHTVPSHRSASSPPSASKATASSTPSEKRSGTSRRGLR